MPPPKKISLNVGLLRDNDGWQPLNKAWFLGRVGIGGVPLDSHDLFLPVLPTFFSSPESAFSHLVLKIITFHLRRFLCLTTPSMLSQHSLPISSASFQFSHWNALTKKTTGWVWLKSVRKFLASLAQNLNLLDNFPLLKGWYLGKNLLVVMKFVQGYPSIP